MSDMHHINVTAEDIAWGVQQDRWACAIVRAIQRERPEATFVKVDSETIAYSENDHRYFFVTPQAAIDKVIRPFDEGREVEPVTIRLNTAPQIRQVQHMTAKDKAVLRQAERNRTVKEKAAGKQSRKHNRFCEVPNANS